MGAGVRELPLVELRFEPLEVRVAAMVAGFRSSQNPGIGGGRILSGAKAVHQEEAELYAGGGVALLRGFLEPVEGVVVVLANANATEEKIALAPASPELAASWRYLRASA
jgi:hypothetical protein